MSATDCYRSGRLDQALLLALQHYDEIVDVILPTLGAERRATYSPFLPISAQSGRVLQVPLVARDVEAGTIVYREEDGSEVETPVTGGRCKLQWKADWAMRWVALGVDYEMAGKDLIDSVRLASRICTLMGGRPPQPFIYELFLDDNGEKISKSRGNGLSVDDWLKYAPAESLSLFMFQKPKTAKRLFFGVIPKTVDEYIDLLRRYPEQDAGGAARQSGLACPRRPAAARRNRSRVHRSAQSGGRVSHRGQGGPVALRVALLAQRHAGNGAARRSAHRSCDRLLPRLRQAGSWSIDARVPRRLRRCPIWRTSCRDCRRRPSAEVLQNVVYAVGKRHPVFADLKSWFQALYQILLGQSEGPRMGSFIALYGVAETVSLVRQAIAGEEMTCWQSSSASLSTCHKTAILSEADLATRSMVLSVATGLPRRCGRSIRHPRRPATGPGAPR